MSCWSGCRADAGILFASDRAGTFDLWMVPVDKGQAQGAARAGQAGRRPDHPDGTHQDGRVLLPDAAARSSDVYTASLDPEPAMSSDSPKKEPLPFEGQNLMPDWSPDGKQLAYVSMRPGEKLGGVLCIYSADTGKVREYPPRQDLRLSALGA